MTDQYVSSSKGAAKREWLSFLFITLILLPGITVLGVGAYGFYCLDPSNDLRPTNWFSIT